MKKKHTLVLVTVGLELILALILLWMVAGWSQPAAAAPASPLHVCPEGPPTCDYASIQAAVDAATPGAFIKVAGGTYTGVQARAVLSQSVYISKTLNIEGGYSPLDWLTPNARANPTIVDAGGLGRVFVITGNITVVLKNLRITGGDATGLGGGPGIYEGAGGGILVEDATLFLWYCEVYDNVATRTGWGGGGGLYGYDGVIYLDYSIFHHNTANSGTGAGNDGEGGGLAMSNCTASLVGNVIRDNVASYGNWSLGGGMYVDSIGPVMENNVIRDNVASPSGFGDGGGIYFGMDADAVLSNTVVVGNACGVLAGSDGAGIAVEIASPRLSHTTLHSNTGGDGSGIVVFGPIFLPVTITLENTILVSQALGVKVEEGQTALLDGVLWHGNGANTGGSGTITVTNALTGSPAFGDDGYHLRLDSAALDAGQSIGLSFDVDEQVRPEGPAYDLGADELVIVTDTVSAAGGGVIYTDTQGLTITLTVPPLALTQTLSIAFTPIPLPSHPLPANRVSAGHTFLLDAYLGRQHLPGLVFQEPATLTVFYGDHDVSGLLEGSLRLAYWTGSTWADATTTCVPPSSYYHDTVSNVLSVPICHLSQWTMSGLIPGGSIYTVYLPLVLRGQLTP